MLVRSLVAACCCLLLASHGAPARLLSLLARVASALGGGGGGGASASLLAAAPLGGAGCQRASTTTAQQPGTRLVLGLVGEPTTLVPLFGNTSADAEVTGLLFRELVARTPQGLVPDLAARVPRLGDGAHLEGERLVVDWELKPNVHWNDGVAVTSADVIAGWKVALDDVEVVQGREQAQAIERIDVVDAHRFRVVWRKPEPGFAAPRVHRVLPAHPLVGAGQGRKPRRA
jgi:peptide/nickel transport system substrate-binding protein